MQWKTISANSNHQVYQLKHQDKNVLTLTLHPFSNTARVECEDEKRVFLIRKEGFRRNKTVLRNEYGIKIGELGLENKEHFIDVNDERFFYIIHENPSPQLVIYKESKDRPVLVCELNVEDGNTSVHLKTNTAQSHTSLLMALCWYMFQPVAKEKARELVM